MDSIIQVYTIGYKIEQSVISINDFFDSLIFYGIKSLIDIRSNPMPTDYPEFDRGHVHQYCEDKNITYHWAGRQLGNSIVGNEQSQHHSLLDPLSQAYADYMETRNFKIAASQIINMARLDNSALFSEMFLPEYDFRYLLSDYLLLQGLQVSHIISINETREHMLHKKARRESLALVYDRK